MEDNYINVDMLQLYHDEMEKVEKDIALSKSKVASGSAVVFEGMEGLPVKECVVDIESVQDLHGYDYPWVGGSGKNLFNYKDFYESYNYGDVNTTEVGRWAMQLSPDTTYTVSSNLEQTSTSSYVFAWAGDITDDAPKTVNNGIGTLYSRTITTDSDGLLTVGIYTKGTNAIVIDDFESGLAWVQVELSSTATTYKPYSNLCPITGWTGANIHISPTNSAEDGKSYAVSWEGAAGMVYGGTLNVTAGTLTVTHAMIRVDGTYTPNQYFAVTGGGRVTYYNSSPIFGENRPAIMQDNTDVLSDSFISLSDGGSKDTPGTAYLVGSGYGFLAFVLPGVTSREEGQAWFQAHPTNVVYPLATTKVYQLTPTEIIALGGTNNLWADCGDVSVTYGAYMETLKNRLNNVDNTHDLDKPVSTATQIAINHTLPNSTIYGFHINSGISDPSDAVTYLADAQGLTPAHMDYSVNKFDYGDWEHAFFLPRPCMLKYDGTVDYYLNPDDYTLRIDGTLSDVANADYDGNAMMEWGQNGKKIWYKIVPDEDDSTSASIYIADYQADSNFHAWSFINNQGILVDHFYTPIYNGSIDNEGRLRSISGILGSNICKNETATQERAAARANSELEIWDTEVWSDNVLITLLLYMMGKSLNLQTVYGQGLSSNGSETVNDGFITGTQDTQGLFYGTNSGDATTYTNAVKVFGMENFWGFQWRRFGGLVNDNGTVRYKMTRTTLDGTTAEDYVISNASEDYAGYLKGAALPAASAAYIKEQTFNGNCMVPTNVTGGSSATYYCDAMWTGNARIDYASRGGRSANGATCGAALGLSNTHGVAGWDVGAALSCKPMVEPPNPSTKAALDKVYETITLLHPAGSYDSMAQIASIVRASDLDEIKRLFPIGDQIVMPWKDMDDNSHNTDETAYPVAWDIVHHGMVTLRDGSEVPGLFLQMHLCSAYGVQFSHQQAFYVAGSGLSAGTYNVTLGATWGSKDAKANTTWQFTLTQDVPAGGLLSGFERMSDRSASDWRVKSWAKPTDANPIEEVTVSSGSGGTSLGTMLLNRENTDGTLNGMHQVGYGHNRWGTSALRLYLNSAGSNWYSSQEKYDIRPDQHAKQGFMTGFDEEFLAAIKPVRVTTLLNTVEGFDNATEDTFDTFFLPSLEQMNVTPQLAGAEGDYFEYWRERLGVTDFVGTGAGNVYDAFKIPAINLSSPQHVRLRSAYRGFAYNPWSIYASGYVYSYGASGAYRFIPVCVVC